MVQQCILCGPQSNSRKAKTSAKKSTCLMFSERCTSKLLKILLPWWIMLVYQKGVTHNPTVAHQNPTKTYQSYNKAHRHWHILKLWQISWLLHGFVWPIPWLVPATRNECQFEHGGTSINRPQWWIDWDLVDFVGVMSTLPCKTALLHAPTDSSPTPQFCSAIHWLGADLAAPWPR